jgi:hypothetical protein
MSVSALPRVNVVGVLRLTGNLTQSTGKFACIWTSSRANMRLVFQSSLTLKSPYFALYEAHRECPFHSLLDCKTRRTPQ